MESREVCVMDFRTELSKSIVDLLKAGNKKRTEIIKTGCLVTLLIRRSGTALTTSVKARSIALTCAQEVDNKSGYNDSLSCVSCRSSQASVEKTCLREVEVRLVGFGLYKVCSYLFFYTDDVTRRRSKPWIHGVRTVKDALGAPGRCDGGNWRRSTVVHYASAVVHRCPRVRTTDAQMCCRRSSETIRWCILKQVRPWQ